ncbi:MAG: hypothetical protein IPM36_08360 [Lewinellaceae bacterium]|nr:hypothetical protein [Lewinellaceae bacterium]
MEQVHTPHGVIDYYLIYLNTPRDDEFFDWENCSFYDVNDSERRTFKVKTALEYYDSANGKVLKPRADFNKPGQPKFDLFRFYYYISGGWFYVSERLKEAIMDAKLTGIQFDPLVCHEAGESVELSGGG